MSLWTNENQSQLSTLLSAACRTRRPHNFLQRAESPHPWAGFEPQKVPAGLELITSEFHVIWRLDICMTDCKVLMQQGVSFVYVKHNDKNMLIITI